jgi:hypothetical protein
MAKTIASGVGMTNAGLAEQGVLSLKTLWAELAQRVTRLGSDPVNCFREATPHEILAEQAATVMVPTNRYRRSPPHVSTRFIAPSETFVHWLNAIRVILLSYDFMIFKKI